MGAVVTAGAMMTESLRPEGIDEQWVQVRTRLRQEVGDAAFNSWLKPLGLVGLVDAQITLSAPTRFMRDWVQSHYLDRIRELWKVERAGVRGVSLQVKAAVRKAAAAARGDALPAPEPIAGGLPGPAAGQPPRPVVVASSQRADVRPEEPTERQLSAPLDPRFTFDSFVVGKSNEFAHAAARRVAESETVAFNPLFLYGGVGLGKTHLMHAIGWHIRQRFPNRKVIYLSAEKFLYEFVRAVRFQDTMAFKETFRSVDVLMIDDIQFIAGKNNTQEEFFHTFNALCDRHRQIIISGDRSPSDLDGIEERIRSRLGWGLVADVQPTDYELRLAILQAKADRAGWRNLAPKVLEFLAHRITSNVRELEGALNRLVAYANLVGRPITLETAGEVLQDLLRANDRRVTIEEIQKKVAEHYNIKFMDMTSARRARVVARPRQVAMYLAKQLTSRSLPEIGRKFGGRDHTTVMHAVKKIEQLRSTDSAFAEDIDLLKRMLEA